MCHADISTIPFRYGEDETDYKVAPGYVHTCRDWDAFEDYVLANEMKIPFRPKHVEDIILGGEWNDVE
jgi:hypothetical protein